MGLCGGFEFGIKNSKPRSSASRLGPNFCLARGPAYEPIFWIESPLLMLVSSVLVCLGTIPYALRAQPASIDIHTQHANHASSYKLLAVGASRGVPPLWIERPLTNQPTNLWGGGTSGRGCPRIDHSFIFSTCGFSSVNSTTPRTPLLWASGLR